jgi:hypothetical protein
MSDFDKDKFIAGFPAIDRLGRVVRCIRDDGDNKYPLDADNGACYTYTGSEWHYGESDNDLIAMLDIPDKYPINPPDDFRERVFLAALPALIAFDNGNSVELDTVWAWRYADEAIKQRDKK